MDFKRYVINLETRPDRRQQMDAQLRRVGWKAEFVTVKRPDYAGGFPSIGARGCFESHLSVLRRGVGSNIILMEDDFSFARDFRSRWPSALSDLPPDWSIFYPASSGVGLIAPSTGIVCAHMVVFRSEVVPRIVAGLETIMARSPGHPLGGPMHVDGAYSTIREQNPDIKTYAAFPPLGYQRRSRSDISPASFLQRAGRLVNRAFGF
jgi:glycosyl transferase family 25